MHNDIVITLYRTDTTLDQSQKARKDAFTEIRSLFILNWRGNRVDC